MQPFRSTFRYHLWAVMRGNAAVWAVFLMGDCPWQPRGTSTVTWGQPSPKHLQVSPFTSVSIAVICWGTGSNCKTR